MVAPCRGTGQSCMQPGGWLRKLVTAVHINFCMKLHVYENALWGHGSILIDSDLGALQPYFFIVTVTAASPFFACMQLRDKRCCWRFEKTFFLQKKLSFWPSEVALPFIPAPCSGVVHSSWLDVWLAEMEVNGLPALDSSCDLDDSVVWTSVFRSERTRLAGEAWKFVSDLENLKCNAGSNTLCGFGAMYAFFMMTSFWDDFWQTFQWASNFWICFRDQWDKSFQTREGCN